MNVDKGLVCSLFELKYINKLGYDPKDIPDIRRKIFPQGWLETEDYDIKIKLLSEAIGEEKLIVDTEQYKNMMKGKKL